MVNLNYTSLGAFNRDAIMYNWYGAQLYFITQSQCFWRYAVLVIHFLNIMPF